MQLERAFSKLIVIREKFRILFSLKYGRITHMEISFGFSWNFLGLIEFSYSTCFRLVLKLPMRSPYIVLVMSQKCPRFVLELSSSCFKSVLKLSKSCPKVVLQLSQSCTRVVLVILELSQLSQECPRSCPKVVRIVLKFFSVVLEVALLVLGLSQICPRIVLKLSSSCPRVVLLLGNLPYSIPIVFLKMFQWFLHWLSCP